MTGLATALLVGLAGGLGSALRYLVDTGLSERLWGRFPWGTMAVNLSGSLFLGLVTGLALGHTWSAAIGTGLLGGYTTFSTASLETIRLLAEKRYRAALFAGPGMLLASTTLALIGIVITMG